MAAPIDLRNDFDSVSLRRLAKRTRDATQSRRLLALAEVYDGGSRTDASRIGGVGLQIIRDWVLRFNARGPLGLVDGKSRAHPRSSTPITAAHWRRLLRPARSRRCGDRALAAQGPGAVALGDVRHSLDETTVGRELKALGFAKISARPRHYGKTSWPSRLRKKLPRRTGEDPGEAPERRRDRAVVADEARIGQKNKLTRRWARRGTRPRAPRDQRTEWAYIFGAICPAKGKGAGGSCPGATPTPWRRTSSRSVPVDPGAHAVLIVDQAGWHLTPKLAIPLPRCRHDRPS